ncbi:hypothetical protein SAMN05421854_110179 [Amycolatopsis rubida]|uniref:Uncharacterized protein n=1 Tax=Amycolatopsis rubida TaxID=112413 RepID=A0A1I5XE40_9PSEU|nr:hypothetical protein SAMN05421854_110179 [Amycolatopsis rubida]
MNLLGKYSFLLPADLADGLRPLSDPDTVLDADDEDEDLE